MSEEMIDFVNEQDEVMGSAPRTEIYAQRLRHRIAHVFLFDREGNIALARRGKEVSYCPDHWTSTAAGHISAGESYEEAAKREMQEEIGVVVPLHACGVTSFLKEGTNHPKFLGTFRAEYEGAFVCDPREVQYIQYFSPAKIREMLAAGERFHPETVALLNHYFL